MIVKTPGEVGKLQQVKEREKPTHARLRVGKNINFKIIVYVEDDCEPCDLVLDAVADVEALNKHVVFELVNLTYTTPQHEVAITPTIYSVSQGKVIMRVQAVTAVDTLNVKLIEEILAGSYIFTHTYTETLIENLSKVAKNCNVCLNDQTITQRLLVKILSNVDEYGAPLCPCRPALKPEEYQDYSCPCIDARTMCKCHCTLLVNPKKTQFTKQVEYLDLLSQVMLRLSGAINTLVEDDVREAKFTVSRGLLSTLLEANATLNEISHIVMRKYKKNTETVK